MFQRMRVDTVGIEPTSFELQTQTATLAVEPLVTAESLGVEPGLYGNLLFESSDEPLRPNSPDVNMYHNWVGYIPEDSPHMESAN